MVLWSWWGVGVGGPHKTQSAETYALLTATPGLQTKEQARVIQQHFTGQKQQGL